VTSHRIEPGGVVRAINYSGADVWLQFFVDEPAAGAVPLFVSGGERGRGMANGTYSRIDTFGVVPEPVRFVAASSERAAFVPVRSERGAYTRGTISLIIRGGT